MESFISFVRDHWYFIADCFVVITAVVVFFLRKRPIKMVDSVKTLILDSLPDVIRRAEKYVDVMSGHRLTGEEKMNMVMNIVHAFLFDECGIPEADFVIYDGFVREAVENILDTPQKKGE